MKRLLSCQRYKGSQYPLIIKFAINGNELQDSTHLSTYQMANHLKCHPLQEVFYAPSAGVGAPRLCPHYI